MIFGLTAFRCSAPSPIFSSAPGRLASTNTSDFAASLRITSCACGLLRSSTRLRLLRLSAVKLDALAVANRRRGAAHVAARRLDLDDVGAHVGQQRAAQRAGDEVRQLDDADAGERFGIYWTLRPALSITALYIGTSCSTRLRNAAGPSATTGRPILTNFSLTSGLARIASNSLARRSIMYSSVSVVSNIGGSSELIVTYNPSSIRRGSG